MLARQFAYVFWKICFIRRHENRLAGRTGQINPCAPGKGKLQVVLIGSAESCDCRRTQARGRCLGYWPRPLPRARRPGLARLTTLSRTALRRFEPSVQSPKAHIATGALRNVRSDPRADRRPLLET